MSFAETIRTLARDAGLALPPGTHPEPLAALPYEDELGLKQKALEAIWREHRLPEAPEAITAAPQPRGYRATSKRRASMRGERLTLSFPGAEADVAGVAPSRLDRPEHLAVYTFLAATLSRPSASALAEALHFAIVRGRPGRLAVVLNVSVFDARVVRAAKGLAEALSGAALGVLSAFLYLDPTESDYYLEARRPVGVLSFKRLFGPESMDVAVEGTRLFFPPVVFSQVNEAILPTMVARTAAFLAPLEGRTLLDLYCGYGLFSFTVGRGASDVVGVDVDGPAVEAAQANALYFKQTRRIRFHTGRIDAAFIRGLRAPRGPEVALLDPPRQGTEAGVVEALAERRPERVVHICCGTDEIPRELAAWQRCGYRLRSAVPLDLFAGTAGLETLLQLSPL